jgi:arylsulfatase A-like enzyme
MKTDFIVETASETGTDTAPECPALQLRASLLLLSIVALFSLGAEVNLIEQVDSLSLYMTYGEIALDAGVALTVLVTLAALWWLVAMLSVRTCRFLRMMNRDRVRLGWYLGLSLPTAYVFLDIFGAVKAQIFPQWHSGLIVWVVFGGICLSAMLLVDLPRLQEFNRTRLVPIAWVHIALVVIAVTALEFKGVHWFHNYDDGGNAAAVSQLPDIYLITADALAADDTSLYGYDRPTTPHLARFAQQSFVFDYFFANSNFTASSTTSIATGKLPWSHRVFQQGAFLRGESQRENIAELLHQRGYYTAMIVENQWAAPFRRRTHDSYDAVEYMAPLGLTGAWMRSTNLIGVNTQYTLYGALLKRLARAISYIDAVIWPYRYPAPAALVFDQARTMLERPDFKQPHFLWTHILAPHDPYLPPRPYLGRFLSTNKTTQAYDFLALRNYALPTGTSREELRARYDEMVLYADAAIGDFIDWLDQTGRLSHAIVILTADHGESFEHHWFLHAGPPLYNGLIHIPLLIHMPGQLKGMRVSQPAQQADILPTILELVGAPKVNWADGLSLRPALDGKRLPDRLLFSMNLEPDRVFAAISKGTVAAIDNEFKYVIRLDSHEESLYRYKTDHIEQNDLIASEPGAAKRLHDALQAKLNDVNKSYNRRP